IVGWFESTVDDEGLRQPRETLDVEVRSREEILELAAREKLDLTGTALRDRAVLHPLPVLHRRHLQAVGEELEERDEKMRLDRKIPIGALHEIALPDPHHLVRHPPLIVESADVLDDRVGEHHIELAVRELRHRTSIADAGPDGGMPRLRGFEIEDMEVDVGMV